MMRMMIGICLLFIILAVDPSSSQSNYALQALDVEYANGLPQTATLDGKVTELDSLKPSITLNRTSADLNCAAGSMHVQLKFKEPFFGVAYADYDRSSACFIQGTGDITAVLEFPLKGCGTKQDPARVFTNNVIVRFHPGLEMEGDEVITVVCRYPPPIVPAPPLPIINVPPPAPVLVPKPLNEFEVLMIICTLLFLGLMLLGLACSTYCLKQRNIQVIRKRPFTPMEEESDKVSEIESFTQLKIPRVQAPSISSSEPPLEETLASDYPSSIEEGPQRPETVSSEYSDTHVQVETETVPVFTKARIPHRAVQSTEYLDTMTVVDRQDMETAMHYVQPRKPELSVHTVDDVYLQTIVERRLIEDEERTTREVTQFYQKEQPRWDVVIKTHPTDEDDRWERGSETTEVSSVGWSTVEEPPIHPSYSAVSREHLLRRHEVLHDESERSTVTRAMQKLQQDDTQLWNEKWRVLLRVLESPPPHMRAETDDESEVASVLTEEDREKWRHIITTESTLRTLLTQATYKEDYERISRDTRYVKLFEPEKWDVIIRTLAPPQQTSVEERYYDSTSEVSTSSGGGPLKPSRMFRKKSTDTNLTDTRSITDVRSMTETTVEYGFEGRGDDASSVVSSGPGAARSIGTEIVEFAPMEISYRHDAAGMDVDVEQSTTTRTVTRKETRVLRQAAEESSSLSGVVQQSQQSSSSASASALYSNRVQRQGQQ